MNTYISEGILFIAKQYNLLYKEKEMNLSNFLKNSFFDEAFILLVEFEFPLLLDIEIESNKKIFSLKEASKLSISEAGDLKVIFCSKLNEKIQEYLYSYITKFNTDSLTNSGNQWLQYRSQRQYFLGLIKDGGMLEKFGKKINFEFDESYDHNDSFLPLHIIISLEKEGLLYIDYLNDLTSFGEKNNSIQLNLTVGTEFYENIISKSNIPESEIVYCSISKDKSGSYFTVGDSKPMFLKNRKEIISILNNYKTISNKYTKAELGYGRPTMIDSFKNHSKKINAGIDDRNDGLEARGFKFKAKKINKKWYYLIEKKGH